ncbi:MAG: DoxX family protein [Nitrospiraceae bacterium]|nr:DoxX family protein [Nitrospiraceae bacterium]
MELTRPAARWKTVGVWALALILAAFFLVAGGLKLRGTPSQVDNFAHWGYAAWFLYAVGAVETAGALGLLVPRLAGFAAMLLGGTMLGAALTHLVHDEMKAVPVPLVILGLLAVIGYARRGPVVAFCERLTDI